MSPKPKPEGELSPIQINVEDSVDLTKLRDDICLPICSKILKHMAKRGDTLVWGTHEVTEKSAREYYQEFVAEEIMPIVRDSNILVKDINYLFGTLRQSLDFVKQIVELTVLLNIDKARARKWNLKDKDDLTLKAVEEFLDATQDDVKGDN